jgi:hypothetical protein
MDLCKIPKGKASVGEVVNQRRKPLSAFLRFSITASKVFNQEMSK